MTAYCPTRTAEGAIRWKRQGLQYTVKRYDLFMVATTLVRRRADQPNKTLPATRPRSRDGGSEIIVRSVLSSLSFRKKTDISCQVTFAPAPRQ